MGAVCAQNNGDLRSSLGPCALIRIDYESGGSIHVILSTLRNQVVNPDVWESFDIDPLSFDILVVRISDSFRALQKENHKLVLCWCAQVKSTNHFYGGFAPVASELFYVNTGLLDGLTPYPNDPRKTAYTKLSRPIWPRVADPHSIGSKDVAWEEEVEELADAVARL